MLEISYSAFGFDEQWKKWALFKVFVKSISFIGFYAPEQYFRSTHALLLLLFICCASKDMILCLHTIFFVLLQVFIVNSSWFIVIVYLSYC